MTRRLHVAAGVILSAMALVNMRAWFLSDMVPNDDFAGYAAALQYVRDSLLHYGRVPFWSDKWFAGATSFVSCFKELLASPFAVVAGPLAGLKLGILAAKTLAALAFYGVFVRHFRAPVAGVLAAYAYAFGACANHATMRLDVALSYLFFPLILVSTVGLLQRRGPSAGLWLGVLMACQFDTNPLQASVAVVMFFVVVLSPWRAGCQPGESRKAVSGSLGRPLAAGALAFLLLAGSQLAWLIADAKHHVFFPPEHVEREMRRLIEPSPFLLLNRANWMHSWLLAHQSPDAQLGADPWLDARYLGALGLAACALGWWTVRRRPVLRRWYQLGLVLFLFQYWLSMGPRTFVWELWTGFHRPEALARGLEMLATVVGLACLGRAIVAALYPAGRRPSQIETHRMEAWAGIGLLLVFASFSFFGSLHRVLPTMHVVRSPGKFFDLAPFSLSLVLGVSLIGIGDALPTVVPSARSRCLVTLVFGLLLVIDFWPSTLRFYEGTPATTVADAERVIGELPGEEGTLRAMPVVLDLPLVSFLLQNSGVGGASNWVPWQANTYWQGVSSSMLGERGCPSQADASPCGPLTTIARVKYLVQGAGLPDPHPPWRFRVAGGGFAVWERPEVLPIAYGVRSYVVLEDGETGAALPLIRDALADNLIVVSVRDDAGPAYSLVSGASLVLPADGRRSRDRWRAWLAHAPAIPRLDVAYRRPSPERIVVEADAGSEPALVFVSETYHPWWSALVDGRPAALVRAQEAFMAVAVPAGRHTVDMRLVRPAFVAAADRITAASWCLLPVALVLTRREGRRRLTTPSARRAPARADPSDASRDTAESDRSA